MIKVLWHPNIDVPREPRRSHPEYITDNTLILQDEKKQYFRTSSNQKQPTFIGVEELNFKRVT